MQRSTIVFAIVLVAASGCSAIKRFAYSGFSRDGWQKPEQVIEALGLQPGARVADLGAGGGYFTFRLADAVGRNGRVLAIDVDPGMIEYLDDRIAADGVPQITSVLAPYDSPGLEDASVDMIFTCNTYHHIEDRTAYFQRAARTLRPGGRVAIVEFKPEGFFQWLFPHATPVETIKAEMTTAGFRLSASHEFLGRQSFLIFTR